MAISIAMLALMTTATLLSLYRWPGFSQNRSHHHHHHHEDYESLSTAAKPSQRFNSASRLVPVFVPVSSQNDQNYYFGSSPNYNDVEDTQHPWYGDGRKESIENANADDHECQGKHYHYHLYLDKTVNDSARENLNSFLNRTNDVNSPPADRKTMSMTRYIDNNNKNNQLRSSPVDSEDVRIVHDAENARKAELISSSNDKILSLRDFLVHRHHHGDRRHWRHDLRATQSSYSMPSSHRTLTPTKIHNSFNHRLV